MSTFGDRIENNKANNLNAIRLLLALAVILSHAFPLTLGWGGEAQGEPMVALTHQQDSCGSMAVNLFFLISGMLITASWLGCRSMQEFLMKRFLRIYPGFIVAMGLSGVVIWMLCPEFRAGAGHGAAWFSNFVKDCFLLRSSSLDWKGIFAGNPLPDAANGSLWTIPIEFACYLLVAWIGLFCLFKYRRLLFVATILIYLVYVKNLLAGHDVSNYTCRFLTYFMIGMNFWLWRNIIPFSKWLALGGVVVLLVSSQFKPWFAMLFPYVGGYCTLCLGYGPQFPGMNWTRKTDLSYGTYLYAFPVQQIAAMNTAIRHPLMNFIISAPVILFLAWLSWRLVEQRFLAMKKISLTDFDPGAKIRRLDAVS